MTIIEGVAGLVGGMLNFTATWCFIRGLLLRSVDAVMYLLWAAGFSLWFVAFLLAGIQWAAGFYGLLAVVSAWAWYHDRRRHRRKRAGRALGAKSRALLAALARKARDAAQPRPAPQPAPGGASCT